MFVECWVRELKSGRVTLSSTAVPNSIRHWARWKPLTVGNWRQVSRKDAEGRSPSGPEQERRMWEFLLEDTSLWSDFPPSQIHNEWGTLTSEACRLIFACPWSFLPRKLVRPLFAETYISVAENARIERECQMLWLGESGRGLVNPHPLLEEAVLSMALVEKYGISAYPRVDDMPQKTWLAFRLVTQTYATVMEMRRNSEDLRQEARRLAGMSGS